MKNVEEEIEAAIGRLDELYQDAVAALKSSLAQFVKTKVPPTAAQRAKFRYPQITLVYEPDGPTPISSRAYAKFNTAGTYTTSVTHPRQFAQYLREQLVPLVGEYGAKLTIEVSDQEIPYAYVVDGQNELGVGDVPPDELARWFPTPTLDSVGDEIVDGLWDFGHDDSRPLGLYDALRVDYSLKRLMHYSGTDWQAFQPWILFTNYARYVDEFVLWAANEIQYPDSPYYKLVCSGGVDITIDNADDAVKLVASGNWRKYQMPAYHLLSKEGDGITLVNIGVGPSNTKNITDHLAVLRPNCWLMVGHCGGLRQSQKIGHYVLAHAYLRRDNVLDDILPLSVPIPPIAEVQIALQNAAIKVTGEAPEALKRRLRTGTVVSFADRNWELYWSSERQLINMSRAIGVDMESCMVAAQGFRHRVPYGTLLCISDKPVHGEIKLPGAANVFYERAIGEHLKIGIVTLETMRAKEAVIHSRKLRSFDEPPFR
ncbi:MAG: AMP nucleosidase [Hyphomonadaceae bacterium]|nr:MAG: AMP nucleosidase [Hyphomonadaceae bacterium]